MYVRIERVILTYKYTYSCFVDSHLLKNVLSTIFFSEKTKLTNEIEEKTPRNLTEGLDQDKTIPHD